MALFLIAYEPQQIFPFELIAAPTQFELMSIEATFKGDEIIMMIDVD